MSLASDLKKKEFEERFDEFWSLAPARNNRKVGQPEARRKFAKLSDKDSILILQAVRHYRDSKDVKAGIGIRDPHRFIRDGRGYEIWREDIPKIKAIPRQESASTEPGKPSKPRRMVNPDSSRMSLRQIAVHFHGEGSKAVQMVDESIARRKRKGEKVK